MSFILKGPTDSFSGAKEKTPRYNYNQIMYRLRLDDLRLKAAQERKWATAQRTLGKGRPSDRTGLIVPGAPGIGLAALMAPALPVMGVIALIQGWRVPASGRDAGFSHAAI